ncbi:hypothetical protein [Pseudomonas sp. CFBP 13719]|uniref:hypothetical protein n=1 Tax=Pseudomonas sp. CFBP 13719 TaxID=2775303 RepID=UPI001781646C|nr:hypothetical protein [Pseudomonas sp. CFBP 13719]MBD8685031.1 hypothetical protein [Pseudomonas sp. CFBP 13719]
MAFSPDEIEKIRQMLANAPQYPDLAKLIADGQISKKAGGYEPITQAGFDALRPFARSVTVNQETHKSIIKLYPNRRK